MVDAFDALVRAAASLCRHHRHAGLAVRQGVYYLQKRRGLARFVSVQNHYNPIWREDERELMPFCRAEGIGLIRYSPMARGFLCGPRRRDGTDRDGAHAHRRLCAKDLRPRVRR